MKKVTIINGLAAENNQNFENDLNHFLAQNNDRFEFENFNPEEMKIKFCCGCWGCWLKTPGKCVQEDEMPRLLRSIIHSDLTLFISPIRMGFVSADVKKIIDKIIPLVHPYIEIVNGECHHRKRYDHYPKIGLILVDKDRNKESHNIITGIFQRLAINFRTELAFSILSDGNMEEIEHAINHI